MAKPISVSFQVREEDSKDLYNFLAGVGEPKAPTFRQLMLDGIKFRLLDKSEQIVKETSTFDVSKINLDELKNLLLPLILKEMNLAMATSTPVVMADSSLIQSHDEVVEEDDELLGNLLGNFV